MNLIHIIDRYYWIWIQSAIDNERCLWLWGSNANVNYGKIYSAPELKAPPPKRDKKKRKKEKRKTNEKKKRKEKEEEEKKKNEIFQIPGRGAPTRHILMSLSSSGVARAFPGEQVAHPEDQNEEEN